MRVSGRLIVRAGVTIATGACVALWLSAAGMAARQSAAPVNPPPARLNALGLDLGARVERATSRYDFPYGPYKLLDDDPTTVWASSSPVFPQELVFAFAGRDTVLVAGLSITFPRPGTDPGWGGPNDGKVWAKDVEVWTSNEGPAAGFTKATAAVLPMASGTHAIAIASPVRARFIKLVVLSNHGSTRYAVIADVAVREGDAPGYQPLLQPPRGPGGGAGGPRPCRGSARRAAERHRSRRVRGGRGDGTLPQAREQKRAGGRQGS